MRRIRSHMTYSSVMATIAVFLALGGIGYAAATINGKDIKKHSEPGNRLKNETVTGKQISEETVGGTSRPLVYNSGLTTSKTKLASVRIGGHKWVFKGACVNDGGTVARLEVHGPSVFVQQAGVLSVNGAFPGTAFVSPSFTTTAGKDDDIASEATDADEINRQGGSTALRKGHDLMQLEYHITADDHDKICSISGTVTPAT